VRFEVLTALNVGIPAFCDTTLETSQKRVIPMFLRESFLNGRSDD
jgi:hypothetical protein